MTTDDREILGDMRQKLHGMALALGQIEDQAFARELEGDIDVVINKMNKKLKRKMTTPNKEE
jgi:hypothetical protein